MKTNPSGRSGRRAAVLAAAVAAACTAVLPFMASGNVGSSHNSGLFCTTDGDPTDAAQTTATFDLTATDGRIQLPDGTTAYMWGYATAYSKTTGRVQRGRPGKFQHPGPVLCVREGQTVTIVLHNALKHDDVSIVFPGQTGVTANGAAVQPQTSGGAITSLAQVAPKDGGTMTYTFTADHPGTFLYESGTDPQTQVRMGLFGALIVRPNGHPDWAYGREDSRFNPNTEYLGLLSEIDPYLNQRVELRKTRLDNNQPAPAPYNFAKYKARYWLINGRGFPDSIADNFATWLPTQPYGALAEIQPKSDDPGNPFHYPSLDRYLSVGTLDYPFHPHGNDAKVIGRDGRPVTTPGGDDVAYDKFSLPIGPGQTWDALFEWTNREHYSSSNPIPTTDPQLQNLVVGTFYSGTPYLGTQGPLPPGFSSQNECGEYYIIAHNHALFQITSWGVNMTGPITYTRVNPPNKTCP